jgi:hypothetical protein
VNTKQLINRTPRFGGNRIKGTAKKSMINRVFFRNLPVAALKVTQNIAQNIALKTDGMEHVITLIVTQKQQTLPS